MKQLTLGLVALLSINSFAACDFQSEAGFLKDAMAMRDIASSLSPADVVPGKFVHGETYVRVTKLPNDRIKFEKCVKGYGQSTCEQLGKKASYSKKELEKQRSIENWQITGAAVADVGVVLVAIFGGAAVGSVGGAAMAGTANGAVAAGGSAGLLLGGAAGAVGGVVANTVVDALNPIEQTRQAKTLNSEVLNDETVVVKDVDNFVERLELVLNKIK